MRRTIEVTQDDIDKGCRGDSNNCPVARALLRSCYIPTERHDRVCAAYNYLRVEEMIAKTPKKVKTFIDRFDGHKPVKPFTVNINFKYIDWVLK